MGVFLRKITIILKNRLTKFVKQTTINVSEYLSN